MIPQKQLSLADILKIAKIFLNLTNLSFFHCLKITLTLMKLFRFLFITITMQPLAETVNIP